MLLLQRRRCRQSPTIKCQAETCRDRPYDEFLDALFDAAVKADDQYRCSMAGATGVYSPRPNCRPNFKKSTRPGPWFEWAIACAICTRHPRATSSSTTLRAWRVGSELDLLSWLDKFGALREEPIIKAWQKWAYRRQYRGVRFCPQPEGPPDGVYNTYFGFTVEPQPVRGEGFCRISTVTFAAATLRTLNFSSPGWRSWCKTRTSSRGPIGAERQRGRRQVQGRRMGRRPVRSQRHRRLRAGRITGRFNAHLENKLLLMAEEAFWAGRQGAEGKFKDLATGMHMSYERKGLDPMKGRLHPHHHRFQ